MPVAESVSLSERVVPETAEALADVVRSAAAAGTPVYPLGGETALDYGLPAKTPGIGVSLAALNRVVDYPARDMTITVEAGITMAELARTLAADGQRLPIDAPLADRATLGGVIATNQSGPLRYGHGTIRDYVIGIAAVDGRGRMFRGGGRVVKNVAGYDFCKLLVGSLGTLGVITQVTLKVKPLAPASAVVACDVGDWADAERLLAALVHSAATPAFVELAAGSAWQGPAAAARGVARLLVGVEGTAAEVRWMRDTLERELRELGAEPHALDDAGAATVREQLTMFPARDGAPLVLKAAVRPSCVTQFAALVREIDASASLQAHAGNGIVVARFAEFTAGDVSRQLIGRLQPAAAAMGGNVVVLSCDAAIDLTRQARWGSTGAAGDLMRSVKRQFDPADVLNRGRFVY
ncbi:MAG: dehydrogenase [Planctomycetota bacterium]|nr:MAG: dehydrogenase [Planctomycetota bacterium]